MKTCRVFYSWQSDWPNATNRTFIEKALENAAKSIRADDSIQVEPVIERDTAGVAGAPDIAATILAKIEQSQIFVCDVSITNQESESRSTPNPNVLIELGFALKALGPQRIIMVMNSVFGGPELLPFDLRLKRVTIYHSAIDSNDRTVERKKLESALEHGLRTILAELDGQSQAVAPQIPSIEAQAVDAVERSLPNRAHLVKKYFTWWLTQTDTVAPPFPDHPGKSEPDDLLVESLGQTIQLVIGFARLAEAIAVSDVTRDSAQAVYQSFDQLLERYSPRPGFSGTYRITRFDFYKFLGHELFVTFISPLIRENRWDLIADLLEEGIYASDIGNGTAGLLPYEFVARDVELLRYRKSRLKLNRVSLHADLLNDRHSSSDLAEGTPMQQFMAADFFLFLRSSNWLPWSALYMLGRPPRYLVEASSAKFARQLLRPLAVESIVALRERIAERAKTASGFFSSSWWSSPLRNLDLSRIAST